MSKRKRNSRRAPVQLGKRTTDGLPKNAQKPTPAKVARFAIEFLDENPHLVNVVEDALARQMVAPGRYRGLSVKAVIVGALCASIEGKLLDVDVYRTLIELPKSQQRALGLAWRQRNGKKYEITERRVEYLYGRICEAMAPKTPDHTHPVEVEGVIVDQSSGEVLAAVDDLTPEDVRLYCICPPACASRAVTPGIEAWINEILDALWRYMGIPESDVFAVDSYVIQTHFRTRAFGGVANIDPQWVPDSIRPEVSADVPSKEGNQGPRTRDDLKRAATEFLPAPRASHSRKPPAIGPTVPGDFTRIDREFPQAGPEGRLHHTMDPGAANAYRGAGSSRQGGIVNGRDKHVAAAAGYLPDGSPFPPLQRAFACAMGGASKDEALVLLNSYAPNVLSPDTLTAVDRGYLRTPEIVAEIMKGDADLIHDLRDDERGRRIWQEGIDFVDGWFYSSSLPPALVDLPRLPRMASAEDRQKSRARFDERTPYAFRPMGRTGAGAWRFRGPAVPVQVKKDPYGRVMAARGMTVNCPNSPYSHLCTKQPVTLCVSGEPCGCSLTFSVAVEDLPKHIEPRRWGSSLWARHYGRRNLVESFNSNEQYHQRLGRHSIRVHAKKWDLFHGLLTIGLFICQVFNWLQRLGAHVVRAQGYDILDRAVISKCMKRVMRPAPRMDDSPDPPAAAV